MQQNPIVVDVSPQLQATPEISYGSVLLSAVGLVGVILLAALVVGLLVGGGFIWFKKRSAADKASVEPSHVRLRI